MLLLVLSCCVILLSQAAAAQALKGIKLEKPDNPVVKLTTEAGELVIELFPDVAPKHVESFLTLSAKGFYNGLIFHRVVPGFVIQGGDPSGNGTGGPGYNLPAEFNARKHVKGTLAAARSMEKNSAGSQFYVCLDAIPHLDNNYTVFGQVIKGIDIPEKVKQGDKMTIEILQNAPAKKS
ncbi:MAG: peptidylprolyl isomerase [Candidatus Riflebacteria bacterium]|nr:peptidylprolyl isomerase [Candidatus Riflebacteria bacterium]